MNRRGFFRRAVAMVVWLCFVGTGLAGELKNEPVTSRMRLWRDSLLISTDTVARQATAAHTWHTGPNPGAADFSRENAGDFDQTGQIINKNMVFDNGAWMMANAVAGVQRLGDTGSLQAIFARMDTHEDSTRQGERAGIRSNELLLTYSASQSKDLSIGATLHLTDSSMDVDTIIVPGFAPQDLDHDTFGAGFRLGFVKDLGDGMTFGMLGGLRWDDTDSHGTHPFVPAGINVNSDAVTVEIRSGVGLTLSAQENAISMLSMSVSQKRRTARRSWAVFTPGMNGSLIPKPFCALAPW